MVFMDYYAIILLLLYQWNKTALKLQWHMEHSDKYFESALVSWFDLHSCFD